MALSFFILIISFWNFQRIQGCDCIRTIHIVTLLMCGVAIGVFITSLFLWIREKK